ncbi:MAG: hypothetical protein Q7J38_04475 [Gallionella sp.]|nr:hypothetical protein [Gallionella sp.]
MVADKHGDAGILEAVNGVIHEFDYGEAASPCQTKILLIAENRSSQPKPCNLDHAATVPESIYF